MASEIGVPGSTPDPVADSTPEMDNRSDLDDAEVDALTGATATDPISDTITIHILCPTLSATSRFTINSIPLNATIANLRSRIQAIVPSHPEPLNQTLIVRGRRLYPHDDFANLREALAPITGDELTIHLLLLTTTPVHHLNVPATTEHYQSYRSRSTNTTPLTNRSLFGPDEARNLTNGLGDDFPNGAIDADQFSNIASILRNQMHPSSIPSVNNARDPVNNARDLDHSHVIDGHLQRLSQQLRIAQAAMANSARIADEARAHILPNATTLLPRQRRYPNGSLQSNPFGNPSLIDPPTLILNRGALPAQDPAAYTVTAPNGSRYLTLPPASGHLQPSVPGSPTTLRGPNLTAGHMEAPNVGSPGQVPPTAGPNGDPAGGQQNNAGAPRNAVRQELVNQPRPRIQAVDGDAGGALSRIWLFIRLYFFIYMITEPGTWTRTVFVTMALVFALAWSSDVTRQVYGMIVGPIQRHIERLALAGGPGEQPAAATAENENNQPAPAQNAPDDIWQYLWRAERSLVLLLASLVPGIGERQVQARNAAEAEAERQRQERERERESQQQEEEVPAPDGDRAQT
ncbi:hypothetical protein N7488_006064 [Penicillium malachiteum]|nr:hypothetical protein N7488_006064 [Penicillium malachiteum]